MPFWFATRASGIEADRCEAPVPNSQEQCWFFAAWSHPANQLLHRKHYQIFAVTQEPSSAALRRARATSPLPTALPNRRAEINHDGRPARLGQRNPAGSGGQSTGAVPPNMLVNQNGLADQLT